MAEETITITMALYNNLCESDAKLEALKQGGVDNWDWYGESLENYAQQYANSNDMTLEEAEEELYG